MTNARKFLIAATLLLSLVGGAGQASADPGTQPTPAGVTWEGTTWEGITWDRCTWEGITWE